MALAFGTVSAVATGDSTTTATANKPASLAVGDVMIAHLVLAGANPVNSITPESGWTELHITVENNVIGGSNDLTQYTAYKIADADDVAASDFDFTYSVGTAASYVARIVRFTGQRAIQIVEANEASISEGAGDTVTVATITPDLANSIAVIFAGTGHSAVVSHSTPAMATNNPSWTEAYDSGYDVGSIAVSQAMYYGSRPETSASGNITFVIGTTDEASIGHAGFVSPSQEVSASDSITASDSKALGLSIALAETLTPTDTIASVIGKIRNQAKSVASWVNKDKS